MVQADRLHRGLFLHLFRVTTVKTKQINAEAAFATDETRSFSRLDADELRAAAIGSPSGRKRICLHRSTDDGLHEMLIALRRDVYYPPHRHANCEESYFMVDGEAVLHVFSQSGGLAAKLELGAMGLGKALFARLPKGAFHCLIVRSEVCVFLETKIGPMSEQGNEPAPFPGPGPWAGEDGGACNDQ